MRVTLFEIRRPLAILTSLWHPFLGIRKNTASLRKSGISLISLFLSFQRCSPISIFEIFSTQNSSWSHFTIVSIKIRVDKHLLMRDNIGFQESWWDWSITVSQGSSGEIFENLWVTRNLSKLQCLKMRKNSFHPVYTLEFEIYLHNIIQPKFLVHRISVSPYNHLF